MRTLPLRPSVELPMGPRNAVRGVPTWLTCGGQRQAWEERSDQIRSDTPWEPLVSFTYQSEKGSEEKPVRRI